MTEVTKEYELLSQALKREQRKRAANQAEIAELEAFKAEAEREKGGRDLEAIFANLGMNPAQAQLFAATKPSEVSYNTIYDFAVEYELKLPVVPD